MTFDRIEMLLMHTSSIQISWLRKAFIRELIERNEILINMKDILADDFTEFLDHRNKIEMVVVDDENDQKEI